MQPTSPESWFNRIRFQHQWFFNTSIVGITAGQADFLTVAEHEICHVLGFNGSNDSWTNLISSNAFHGTAAMDVYGGAVPLVTVRTGRRHCFARRRRSCDGPNDDAWHAQDPYAPRLCRPRRHWLDVLPPTDVPAPTAVITVRSSHTPKAQRSC